MKKSIFYLITLLFIASACESSKWEKALSDNSLEAYKTFLKNNPKGQFAGAAYDSIYSIEYRKVIMENTLDSYENFLTKYPENKYLDEIKDSIEQKEYENVLQKNNKKAYENFINKYPQSKYITQVNKKLAYITGDIIWENNTDGYFIDIRDKQKYKVIKIGSQIWMAENLNYKSSRNSWVYNNKLSNAKIYGRLYNWETSKKVCPDSWHLPRKSEWKELVNFFGGIEVAGDKMRETGTLHWNSPNIGATNESGFTALPGGGRIDETNFNSLGDGAHFWSATKDYSSYATTCSLYKSLMSFPGIGDRSSGFSVRCIKD